MAALSLGQFIPQRSASVSLEETDKKDKQWLPKVCWYVCDMPVTLTVT